jgi:hypothetical protein
VLIQPFKFSLTRKWRFNLMRSKLNKWDCSKPQTETIHNLDIRSYARRGRPIDHVKHPNTQ